MSKIFSVPPSPILTYNFFRNRATSGVSAPIPGSAPDIGLTKLNKHNDTKNTQQADWGTLNWKRNVEYKFLARTQIN